MNPHRFIAASLACATATLLGQGGVVQAAEPPGSTTLVGAPTDHARVDADASVAGSAPIDRWTFDSAVLFYSESHRVAALEPVLLARRRTAAGSDFTGRIVVDVLTGASPIGAVGTDRPQTFTHPSGQGRFIEPANQTPLDSIFQDTRIALSADWESPLSRTLRYGLGANVSTEYDYRSLSLNARLVKDFNQKNTTLTVALAQAQDTIDPVGGVPEAMGRVSAARYSDRPVDDDKSLTDLLVGLTQIVDSRSFVQLNYGLTVASGYLNDPYKLVSLVDDQGRPFDISASEPSVIYENRPDKRTRHALYSRYRRLLERNDNIVDVSYRLTSDDWGIVSHTLDTKYRWNLSAHRYVQTRLRYYTQGAADFYAPFLRQSDPVPVTVSADYRLGDMDAWTLGLEYGWGRASSPWRVSLEYYLQQPAEPGGKFGVLVSQEISPPVRAIMLRVNKSF